MILLNVDTSRISKDELCMALQQFCKSMDNGTIVSLESSNRIVSTPFPENNVATPMEIALVDEVITYIESNSMTYTDELVAKLAQNVNENETFSSGVFTAIEDEVLYINTVGLNQ